jgi:uncharacterized protein (DUF2235 family)
MKRLIICCDGTWNSATQSVNGVACPTNVLGLVWRIAKRDGDVSQVVYYDQGIGTGNVLDRYYGGLSGAGLLGNINDAYRFLMANYEMGDEIFLFGFSRGAFTVRSLVGMVRKCGILKPGSVAHYIDSLRLYRRSDCRPDGKDPTDFRTKHSICGAEDVSVHFLGVWDTVGALGIPFRVLRWLDARQYQFHDTELSRCVARAYHALAIDECRPPFQATLWDYVPKDGQKVEQRWFCGVHSDVGGGYIARGLSDIALQWMMEKASECGLAFDETARQAYPLQPDYGVPLHDSRRGAYRLWRPSRREIGVVNRHNRLPTEAGKLDPTQRIHESVLARWDADESYRPANLGEYLRRADGREGQRAGINL